MNYNFETKKDGFQILKNVFSPEETDRIRIIVEKIFNKENQTADDNKNVRWDFFNLNPELRFILFNSVIVNSLREILGQDFLVLDDMAILRSGFGRWHKDTSTLEFYQNKFHYNNDYQMLTVIIYLQDNNEYGGGLDVIPKSHLQNYDGLVTPLNGKKKDFYYYIKRIKPKMTSYFLDFCEKFLHKKIDLKKNIKFTIPSLKGDVIFFDMRLEHKASWPIKDRKHQPDKLALTFTAGRNNVYTKEYMNFLKKRKDFKHLDNHYFRKDFLDDCKKNKINLYF
jgi:ectoine hydroxylase-related dioxygenase (phytanoyl-CoA dioxygenase family)